jgi:phage tail-like protein
MRVCETNFRHVNRDGVWPDFQWVGLERLADGTLRLRVLPRAVDASIRSTASAPTGPGGIAVDWDGSIFCSDTAGNRVLKVNGCTGSTCPAPCVGVDRDPLSALASPRGLLIPSDRRVLYIVDSGHHRVQIVDPETGALQGMLGARGLPYAPPPSADEGRFNEPWALAADAEGHIYVVDHGNRRVQKFDSAGDVDPLFWARMRAESVLDEPADIAVTDDGTTTRVYVLDRARQRVFLFDGYGRCVRDARGEPWQIAERLTNATGLAATETRLYVGDNARRRVLVFEVGGLPSRVGEAVGFDGPVAALALAPSRRLLVHGGGAESPTALTLDAGYGAGGLLWGGPFTVDCPELTWRHVRALAVIPDRGAHLEFFWRLTPLASAVTAASGDVDPFPSAAGWRKVGQDLVDFFVGGDRTKRLWIGARFYGDGSATPTLSQLRLEFDQDSYLKSLPAIYQEQAACGDFFDRFLALFERSFERTEDVIRRLPALADPDAIESEALPWLASWLGLDLDDRWDDRTRRDAIRQAYARDASRGTAGGLQEAIEREAGVRVIVQEPLQHSGWWELPDESRSCQSTAPEWTHTEGSVLGWTTTLVASEPQGAVVGTTATLDRSHLITNEGFAAPLFDDVAYQVQVLMYPAVTGDPRTVERVREIVEREKPAHVTYHLCIAKPELRVGIQARLGVDAIVSGERPASRLGSTDGAGAAIVLGGSPAGQIGPRSQVGVTTRL